MKKIPIKYLFFVLLMVFVSIEATNLFAADILADEKKLSSFLKNKKMEEVSKNIFRAKYYLQKNYCVAAYQNQDCRAIEFYFSLGENKEQSQKILFYPRSQQLLPLSLRFTSVAILSENELEFFNNNQALFKVVFFDNKTIRFNIDDEARVLQNIQTASGWSSLAMPAVSSLLRHRGIINALEDIALTKHPDVLCVKGYGDNVNAAPNKFSDEVVRVFQQNFRLSISAYAYGPSASQLQTEVRGGGVDAVWFMLKIQKQFCWVLAESIAPLVEILE